jgi:hypothetical protein
LNQNCRLCLVSANLGFRREVFDRIGGFAPELQRVKDGIGSMEDLELLIRYWREGGQALYEPALAVSAHVPIPRMTKSYHRRWHAGNGRFYALLRSEELEGSKCRSFLGVPASLVKQAAGDAARWCRLKLSGKSDRAFVAETRLCFFAGFFRQRSRDFISARSRRTPRGAALGEVLAAANTVSSKTRRSEKGPAAG